MGDRNSPKGSVVSRKSAASASSKGSTWPCEGRPPTQSTSGQLERENDRHRERAADVTHKQDKASEIDDDSPHSISLSTSEVGTSRLQDLLFGSLIGPPV